MPSPNPDVILIGGGIMSAHLGAMLKRLDPRLAIEVYEAAPELARESSDGWNNAGTGHAGLCELNYTPPPAVAGAPVDVAKAVEIFARFEQSRRADLWSGIGLACAYAGACDERGLTEVFGAAEEFQPDLAQGAAFAAKARLRAGNLVPHTEHACQAFCNMSARDAAHRLASLQRLFNQTNLLVVTPSAPTFSANTIMSSTKAAA